MKDMEKVFEGLKSLQDVLANEYDIQKELQDAPKELEDQEQLLLRLKTEFIDMNKTRQEKKDEVLQLRMQLDQVQKVRESGEKGMDNISTHREYEALEKQIEDARIKEEDLRSEIGKKDKVIAELDDRIASHEELMNMQEEERQSRKSQIDATMNEKQQKLNDYKAQEEKITQELNAFPVYTDAGVEYKFKRIIARNRKGIVAVKGKVCDGCHMILPAQFANDVKDGQSIMFCPYCSRILFYQDVPEEEESAYSSLDDIGSLSDLDESFEDEDEDMEDIDETQSIADEEEIDDADEDAQDTEDQEMQELE